MNLFKLKHRSSMLITKSSLFTPRIMFLDKTDKPYQETREGQMLNDGVRTTDGKLFFSRTDINNINQL
ncbi:MAG: hypothetical protein KKE16_01025 [Firmicutes bacterium]|nr:hypothetical protein [Bacillota bacterium]